jgi:hypothetical protein
MVPVILDRLQVGTSDVRCSTLEFKATGVKLIVSNRGIRPAVIKTLKLEPKGEHPVDLDLETDANRILEPSKSQIMTFIPETNIRGPEDIRSRSDLYLVIFPFGWESKQIRCEDWNQAK